MKDDIQTDRRRLAFNLQPSVFSGVYSRTIQRLQHILWDWRLALALLVLVGALEVASQQPLQALFDLGADSGMTRASAFTFDFYPPEQQGTESFRWSKGTSSLFVPGIGSQPLGVSFGVLAHRAQHVDPDHPTQVDVTVNGHIASFQLRREGAVYKLFVPRTWMDSGNLDLIFSTPSWQAAGDSRPDLGIAIDQMQIHGMGAPWSHGPYLPVLLTWLGVLLALWLALRLIGFASGTTFMLCTPLVLVPPLATLFAPFYLALGSGPLLLATAWGLVLLTVLHFGLPLLCRRLRCAFTLALLRWLAVIVVVSFILKYGGRVYPGSMHGDLELHWHRYARTIAGTVYILAAHRGLPFPFPGALYFLVAPFQIVGIPPWVAFEFGMALLEASTPLLLTLIGAHALGSMRLGVVAGAVYAAMAGGFMTTWFAFETHIFAQWAMLLLWTVLLLAWPSPGTEAQDYRDRGKRGGWTGWFVWTGLIVIQSWIYLGHTGFLLNTVTLAAIGLPLLLWRTWRTAGRQTALWLTGATLTAGLLIATIYYSAFLTLILGQLTGVAEKGLLEVTGRRPVAASETLRAIWEDGILTHYGFFPLPLALCGLTLVAGRRQKAEDRGRVGLPLGGNPKAALLWWLLALTFLVSASQAVLPFITRSTLTTRYLMFAAWAVALCTAPMLLQLWRRGWVGRLLVLTMAAFVVWGTLVLWAGALAINVAPPEPF